MPIDITNWDYKKPLNGDSAATSPGQGKAQPVILDGSLSETNTGNVSVGYDTSRIDTTSTATKRESIVFAYNDTEQAAYEIENPDDLGTPTPVVCWVYKQDYATDGTEQLVIGIGGGDGTDYSQDGSGTNAWNNTGQDTEARYDFTETGLNFADSTINGNTLDEGVGTSDADGQFDRGQFFDNSDDYAQSDFVVSGDWTIVMWVYGNSFVDGSNGDQTRFFSHGYDFGNNEGFYLRTKGDFNPDVIQVFIGDSKIDLDTTSGMDNEWNLLVAKWDDSASEFILNNDGTINTGTATPAGIDSAGGLALGADYKNGATDSTGFDGRYDEVKMYSGLKSSNWITAEKEASPAGGQVFFDVQAGSTTGGNTVSQTVSDGLTFQENQAFTLAATLSDNLQMQENTPSTLIDTLNDNIGFAENLQATLQDTLTDQLGFTENQAFTLIDTLQDQLQFTEQTLFGAIGVVASDQLTFGEQLDTRLEDTLQDQLQFQENLISSIAANLTDQLAFEENLQTAVADTLQDQLDFTENIAETLALVLTDNLTLQEQITAAFLLDLDITQPTKAIITNLDKFAVMESQTFKQGDIGDKVKATLEDAEGAIDLSGVKQVNLRVQDRSGTQVLNQACTVTDAANGKVEYSWQSGDTPIENAAIYRAEFEIIDANDEPETIPNDGKITMEIEEDIS